MTVRMQRWNRAVAALLQWRSVPFLSVPILSYPYRPKRRERYPLPPPSGGEDPTPRTPGLSAVPLASRARTVGPPARARVRCDRSRSVDRPERSATCCVGRLRWEATRRDRAPIVPALWCHGPAAGSPGGEVAPAGAWSYVLRRSSLRRPRRVPSAGRSAWRCLGGRAVTELDFRRMIVGPRGIATMFGWPVRYPYAHALRRSRGSQDLPPRVQAGEPLALPAAPEELRRGGPREHAGGALRDPRSDHGRRGRGRSSRWSLSLLRIRDAAGHRPRGAAGDGRGERPGQPRLRLPLVQCIEVPVRPSRPVES